MFLITGREKDYLLFLGFSLLIHKTGTVPPGSILLEPFPLKASTGFRVGESPSVGV